MTNFQDLINLAKADGGKFYVLDSDGNIQLVILPVDEYQKLLEGKLSAKIKQAAEDVEKINQEIIKAQLHEPEIIPAAIPEAPKITILQKHPDLREEVIDPSFDFEGPKIEIDDL